MRTIWRGVVVLLCVTGGVSAEEDICAITPTYTFYAVSGRSPQELEESMRQRGPRDELGAPRFAYTDWTVKWKWERLEDGSVDPSSVSLTCIATILLPKVEPPDSLSPEVATLWESFLERTREHELRHVGHVEKTAPQIVQRLYEANRRRGKVSLKRARSIVSDVIADIRAMDRRYDAQTDHGRTEGTWKLVPR